MKSKQPPPRVFFSPQIVPTSKELTERRRNIKHWFLKELTDSQRERVHDRFSDAFRQETCDHEFADLPPAPTQLQKYRRGHGLGEPKGKYCIKCRYQPRPHKPRVSKSRPSPNPPRRPRRVFIG